MECVVDVEKYSVHASGRTVDVGMGNRNEKALPGHGRLVCREWLESIDVLHRSCFRTRRKIKRDENTYESAASPGLLRDICWHLVIVVIAMVS